MTTILHQDAPDAGFIARSFSITTYNNAKSTTPTESGAVGWEKIQELLQTRDVRSEKDGAAFSLHSLRVGATRSNENVLMLSGCVCDVDGGASWEDLVGVLKGLTYCAYTTHSHDPDNGKHKFRTVLPFTRNVTAKEWSAIWPQVNARLGGVLDTSCKDVSRLYYLPSCPEETQQHAFYASDDEGKWIDPDELISAAAVAGQTKPNNRALTGGLLKDYPPMPETPENVTRVQGMLAVVAADCDRETWRNICWAVQSLGWAGAVELIHQWSMTAGSKYDAAEFDKLVSSYNPAGGIGFGTLVHQAKLAGWIESGSIEGESITKALQEFNERYFVGRIGGDVYVFDERDEAILAGGMAFTPFRQLHAGYAVDGANIAAKWLNWPERRTYQKLTFDPSGRCEPSTYNTWRGFSVTPAAGPCERILEHIRMVWCSGDATQYDYVIRWLAMLIQQPWCKPEVALVLRSPEGSGKTLIVQILLDILGPHGFSTAQKDQVAGRFNGHLFDKLVVVLEEAFFSGDPAAVAAIKALVTNKQIGYEAKGKDAFSAANYAHVISLTNHDWAIPAGEDSRRWCVLDIDDTRRGDHAYFGKLTREIEDGGAAALMHHLLSIDLKGWNPRAFPATKALRTQRRETLARTNKVAAWWMDVLADGVFSVEHGEIDWGVSVRAANVQASYLRATERVRGAPGWDTAAKLLRKLVPSGTLGKVRKSGQDGRQFFYTLPELDEARAHFQLVTGVDPCEA